MTPHDLINLNGYGAAKTELIKQGKWDEYNGMEKREFCVELSAEVRIKNVIIVSARHKDEATEMAIDQFVRLNKCDEDDVEVDQIRDSLED